MVERVDRLVEAAEGAGARYADDEVDETVAFLEWLLADHFILLGYREYPIGGDERPTVVPGSGLGILPRRGVVRLRRPRPLADLAGASASARSRATC